MDLPNSSAKFNALDKNDNAEKALVLLSGGIDSATCLGLATAKLGRKNVLALSLAYGQKHIRELGHAARLAAHYGVEQRILDLSTILAGGSSTMLANGGPVPQADYAGQLACSGQVSTYVPFRNGLMLAAAASLAMTVWPDSRIDIWIGAHADDAAGNAYPDCSPDFIRNMDQAIAIGTYALVRLKAPFAGMGKAGIVAAGLAAAVPYQLCWSCYVGGEKPCGQCATCRDRAAAFAANGCPDPALG